MKHLKYVISFIFIALFACGSRENRNVMKVDPFCTNKGFDLRRIPLIKPYELLKVNANEWRMELQTTQLLTLSLHNVKGVNVSKDKIFIYSEGGTEVKNKKYGQAWFIIDPLAQKESFFSDYKVFIDSLKSHNITDTSLGYPDDIYTDFYNNGKLEWCR